MDYQQHHPLIIIGSGPAGLTAGIYAARAKLDPLIIQGHKPGGQLTGTTIVNNWPGTISIMGPELIRNIEQHAKTAGCVFLSETVVNVNLDSKPFTVITHRNKKFTADSLIIATGSLPKMLHCKGEKQLWGKGVTSCAVCDAVFYPDKEVVIVGGGDSAMEYVFALSNYTTKITLVHILDKLTASPALQHRLKEYPIKIIYESTVTEILGSDHVTGVVLTNQRTHELQTLSCEGVFLAIGSTPNTDIVKNQLELDNHNYIKVTNFTHTSKAGVFAAGDVIDAHYRQAITSAGSGCMAALDVQKYLSEKIG